MSARLDPRLEHMLDRWSDVYEQLDFGVDEEEEQERQAWLRTGAIVAALLVLAAEAMES